MVRPHCLVFLLTSSTVYSLCSTPQRGQSLVFVGRLTLQTLLPVFIGPSFPANQVQSGGIVYRALHNTAPQYLSEILRRVADIPSRSLRPSTSSHLVVRPSRLVTVGGTLVCFSWSETLEQSSERYYYGTITTSVSKKTENLPISAIIPGHYRPTVVSDCFHHGGPSSYFLL